MTTGRRAHISEQARTHRVLLRSLGWTDQLIADAAMIAPSTIKYFASGRTAQLYPHTARAVLSIPLEPVASKLRVDATGTWRRVDALQCMGWPLDVIAKRAGLYRGSLRKRRDSATRVLSHVAVAIRSVYDELSDTPGPSAYTARLALTAGKVPAIAWDSDSIDNPATVPYEGMAAPLDETAVQRFITGEYAPGLTLSQAERVEVARRLFADGVSKAMIARKLKCSDHWLNKVLAVCGEEVRCDEAC